MATAVFECGALFGDDLMPLQVGNYWIYSSVLDDSILIGERALRIESVREVFLAETVMDTTYASVDDAASTQGTSCHVLAITGPAQWLPVSYDTLLVKSDGQGGVRLCGYARSQAVRVYSTPRRWLDVFNPMPYTLTGADGDRDFITVSFHKRSVFKTVTDEGHDQWRADVEGGSSRSTSGNSVRSTLARSFVGDAPLADRIVTFEAEGGPFDGPPIGVTFLLGVGPLRFPWQLFEGGRRGTFHLSEALVDGRLLRPTMTAVQKMPYGSIKARAFDQPN